VAFVFGPERTGLANDDVYRCHACLSIPTHPAYGSLNLAQAVQLIAYEWRQAWAASGGAAHARCPRWPTPRPCRACWQHWQQALVAIGFLDPARRRS
jgi:tRNA/rRNA methyltransferase